MVNDNNEEFKTGFIGIVGPTNSGKSTLLNALIGKKLSIVSPRAQTTYHGVSGILNSKESQIVFTDTPGYQGNNERVARLLNDVADQKAAGCDEVVWVFDASNSKALDQILKLKEKISRLKPRELSFCVLNKVDKIDKLRLLPLIQAIWELGIFAEILPMSAKKGQGVDRLIEIINRTLEVGQPLYPAQAISDRPTEFHLAEFVREKIYLATYQEVPYSSWIEIEDWKQEEDVEAEKKKERVPTIRATIHVDSQSRKGILIGKGGEMLKRIGMQARKDIESHLGHQVCLKLFVDVQKDWKDDSRFLQRYLELEG